MRTTVQIEDSLLRDLKEGAHGEGLSLTKFINRVLRRGIGAMREKSKKTAPYRQKTFNMGEPKVNLDKALSLAASIEDDEVIEELARRK